jgi:hypothetical protein
VPAIIRCDRTRKQNILTFRKLLTKGCQWLEGNLNKNKSMGKLRTTLSIFAATAFQFCFEGVWAVILFSGMGKQNLGCVTRKNPLIPLNFVSEMGLTLIIFLYLKHYRPATVWKAMIAGVVIGFLSGINQYVDWYANLSISFQFFLVELIKNLILGGFSAIIIYAFTVKQSETGF